MKLSQKFNTFLCLFGMVFMSFMHHADARSKDDDPYEIELAEIKNSPLTLYELQYLEKKYLYY